MIILRNIAVFLVTSVTLNILYNDYFKHDDDENHTPGYRCDCGIKREFDVSNNVSINIYSGGNSFVIFCFALLILYNFQNQGQF